MKLKNIKSFSHNLTHSFVSEDNGIDGNLVFKALKEMAYQHQGEVVSIYWISPTETPQQDFNQTLSKAIENYQQWLPKLMEQHKVARESLIELRTDVFLASNRQIEVQAYAKDLNGKEYIKNIYDFGYYVPFEG